MNHRRLVIAVAAVAFLSGCARVNRYVGMDPSAPESVTIPIGARGADAVSYLQQAAIRGGFTVSATSPGLVTVGPVSIKEDHRVRMTFYVSVLTDSANVRGTVSDPMMGTDAYPIRANAGGRAAWGWREMTRLANALRTATPR
ncbi:MAG: hypothetical protein V4617_15030 [Gemmatimonadota bacterium]